MEGGNQPIYDTEDAFSADTRMCPWVFKSWLMDRLSLGQQSRAGLDLAQGDSRLQQDSLSKLHLEQNEFCYVLDRVYKFILLITVCSRNLSTTFLTDSSTGN